MLDNFRYFFFRSFLRIHYLIDCFLFNSHHLYCYIFFFLSFSFTTAICLSFLTVIQITFFFRIYRFVLLAIFVFLNDLLDSVFLSLLILFPANFTQFFFLFFFHFLNNLLTFLSPSLSLSLFPTLFVIIPVVMLYFLHSFLFISYSFHSFIFCLLFMIYLPDVSPSFILVLRSFFISIFLHSHLAFFSFFFIKLHCHT
ncbi:unnamed protein product [Acanthosepion pharaonis]|uniref:Uncharacterized protein n=1 Tax=Acanthosepion pharaonis TaxID=158019 RepID=A0A812CA80_ACAPH|nr:unnamed protein product [Sepia pharaonis]